MINAKMLMIAAIMYSPVVVAMDNKEVIVDIRKCGLEFAHNKQDEYNNTFWHKLAIECKTVEDWSEVDQKMEQFKQNNKNWLPNPLIENRSGKTAKKKAKESYMRSGNPVCGLLVVYLKQTELNYLNTMALKSSRDLMDLAQKAGLEHPNQYTAGIKK